MNIPEIVFVIDVTRFILAAMGMIFSAFEWHDTIDDKGIHIRHGENGLRLRVAKTNIQMEQLRFCLHMILVITAVTSIMWPVQSQTIAPVILPRRMIFDRLLMIVATMILTLKSYLARRVRREVQEAYEGQRRRRHTDPPPEDVSVEGDGQ